MFGDANVRGLGTSEETSSTSSANSLAIIVPTIGRPSLKATLSSFASDLRAGDEVHIVDDSPEGIAHVFNDYERWSPADWWIWRNEEVGVGWGPFGHWGHAGRNHVLDNAAIETDYIWTIDDDDVASPGALEIFREETAPWAVYRMHFQDGHPARGITCWRTPRLKYGDIGTPMTLARPCSARFGHYYSGDWSYVQALRDELGDPIFDTRIVALIRPEEPCQ